MTAPWDSGVEGDQVLPLINLDAETIRVEAGPGTGKTFGLARRVVRIMHPEGLAASGRDVLVVAFNRVIAKQLKADIGQALATTGTPHEYPPTILTVHALCLQAIGENVRILLPHEREAMLYDVLHEFPEIGTKYGRKSTAEQALRDHEAKLQENVALWQAVSHWLRRHRARLISELPGMLLDHIQGGDFPDRRYRYVIVDEFQDLTRGEQRLFLMLKAKAGQFVALGDPRQSIYAFRGNDREGLKKIESTIGGPVTDLPMTQCRRCPSQVVEAANQLMSLVPGPRLVPASTVEGNTHVVVWKTPQGEADGMARAILTNLRAHPQDRHLVMVTRRQFGFMLRGKIAELDDSVAVDLCFSESLLESWPVREAFLFFCLLVDPDPPTWRAWLGYQNSPQASSPLAPSRNAGAYLRLLRENGDEITAGSFGASPLNHGTRDEARGVYTCGTGRSDSLTFAGRRCSKVRLPPNFSRGSSRRSLGPRAPRSATSRSSIWNSCGRKLWNWLLMSLMRRKSSLRR